MKLTLKDVEKVMPNIPAPPDGQEWEVVGWGCNKGHHKGCLAGRMTTAFNSGWEDVCDKREGLLSDSFYLVAKPKKTPTTIEDLFPPEAGQCWLISKTGASIIDRITPVELHNETKTHRISVSGFEGPLCNMPSGWRYAHHPLTSFEDATPFINI